MNLKRIVKFFEVNNDLLARQIILDKAQKEQQIIYGARAINRQLPIYLKKKTEDYDILTKKPKSSAEELVNELNRRLGKKEYVVVKAKHKGTYKIKDISGRTIVDYTQLKRIPKNIASWGNRYYDIKSIKKNIQKRLKDPTKEFRKQKDLDALNRIRISEETFNF
jgi:hypothetical protein